MTMSWRDVVFSKSAGKLFIPHQLTTCCKCALSIEPLLRVDRKGMLLLFNEVYTPQPYPFHINIGIYFFYFALIQPF